MQLSSTLVFPALFLASSPAFAAPTNSGSLNTAHKQDLQARTLCLFGIFSSCHKSDPPSSKSCPDSWVWKETSFDRFPTETFDARADDATTSRKCQAPNNNDSKNKTPKCSTAGHSWFSTAGYCSAPAYNAPDSTSCGTTHFFWKLGSSSGLCCSTGGQNSAPAQPPAGKSCPNGNWFWDASNACCIPRNSSDCEASKPTTCSTAGHVWDAPSKCCKPSAPSSSSRPASSTAFSSSAAPLPSSSLKPSSSSIAPSSSSAVVVSSTVISSSSSSAPLPSVAPPTLCSGWTWYSRGMLAEGDGNGRALASDSLTDSNMTPLMCSTYCNSKGYALAGTEFSTQCFCGNSFSYGASATRYSTRSGMTCGGSSDICGGPDTLTIYYNSAYSSSDLVVTGTPPVVVASSASVSASASAPGPTAVLYSGWASFSGDMIAEGDGNGRALASDSLTDSKMTPFLCTSYCASKGYALAGTEFSTQCFCGNGFSYGASASRFSTKNTMTCGGSSEICGGPDSLTVYYATSYCSSSLVVTIIPPAPAGSSTSASSVSSSAPAVASVAPAIVASGWTTYTRGMVAEGTGNGRALASDSLTDSKMTPFMCTSYCGSKGYALAGTEYSTQCFCGNSFSYGASATIFSTRNGMTCGGSSEICGGPDTLTIYYQTAYANSDCTVTATPPQVAPSTSIASSSSPAASPSPSPSSSSSPAASPSPSSSSVSSSSAAASPSPSTSSNGCGPSEFMWSAKRRCCKNGGTQSPPQAPTQASCPRGWEWGSDASCCVPTTPEHANNGSPTCQQSGHAWFPDLFRCGTSNFPVANFGSCSSRQSLWTHGSFSLCVTLGRPNAPSPPSGKSCPISGYTWDADNQVCAPNSTSSCSSSTPNCGSGLVWSSSGLFCKAA